MFITKSAVEITAEKRAKFLNLEALAILKLASPKIEKPYFIYTIRNRVNGMIYVGKCRNIYDRANNYIWNFDHRESKYRKRPIIAAICKFGIDNFEMTPIAIADGITQAAALEVYYISKYKADQPNIGYNIASFYDVRSNTESHGHAHTIQTKQKKSYLVACINPDEKICIISVGMKLFGDLMHTSKDLVKNCARRPCRLYGYYIIYLSNAYREAIMDKALQKYTTLKKAMDRKSYDLYFELVSMVDQFVNSLDPAVFDGYQTGFLTYNPDISADQTYISLGIDEFLSLAGDSKDLST